MLLKVFSSGRNIAIIPGGFEDATIYAYGLHRTAIMQRKGFIEYALQHGYILTSSRPSIPSGRTVHIISSVAS